MTDTIRFVRRGQVVEVTDADPTMTVLQYVREVARLTGTKEGCAEGDCGACTVVLGELVDDTIRYRAVNACILFLPALDGRELIVVEDLRAPDGTLHPVQRAMVESHGSQCGFCTPGFVMSLFAHARAGGSADRDAISDALAGNLCRCTGYAPIVEAATQVLTGSLDDHLQRYEPATRECLRAIRRSESATFVHGSRRCVMPASLDEFATGYEAQPTARLLAGGTDLGLIVTKDHEDLDNLVYVGGLPELRITRTTDTHIEIGGAATCADAEPLLRPRYPDFAELLRRFGSVQIRNSATVAGNLANASPIGDTTPALMALDATVELRRGATRRTRSVEQFITGYRRNALAPGEFIEWIRIPLHPSHRRFAAYKISKRFDQDISIVCAAFAMEWEGDRVRDPRLCFGGMAEVPRRATRCEQTVDGKRWDAETVTAACAALDDDFAPITDLRGTATYRRTVARNLLRKFFLETTTRVATRVVAAAGTVHG